MNAEDLISGLKGYLSQSSSFRSYLPEFSDIYTDLKGSDQFDIMSALADPMKNDLLKWAAVLRGTAPRDISID